MTAWLSPSMTRSVKPHSTKNSTARRQANISASSLQVTGGPFADKEAMTSPLSLQIMAPIPEAPSSWNIDKFDASKLSLNRDSGGGIQLVGFDAVGIMESWVLAHLNSSVWSFALLFKTPGSCYCFPRIMAFRWCQTSQAWTKNCPNSSGGSRFITSSISWIISSCPTGHFCKRAEHPAHTSYATPQFQSAWITVSGSVLQASQRLTCIIRFWAKFTRVGNTLRQARHPKTLILLGTFSFHKVFHIGPPTTPVEHSTQSDSFDSWRATRYPELTEYSPDLLGIQSKESEIYLRLRGTRNIASASSRWKFWKIKPLSHHLNSVSINSETNI